MKIKTIMLIEDDNEHKDEDEDDNKYENDDGDGGEDSEF